MTPRQLTTLILTLIVGFSGGWLVGSRSAPRTAADAPTLEASKQALEELVAYRGTGARAARKTIDLVDTIVAGGEAMVPEIDAAFGRVSPTHRYTSSGDQAPGVLEIDTERGILSRHTNGTMALLEALDRIGGQAALQVLFREAEREGKATMPANRLVATLFLAHRGDRADVRLFLNALVEKYLVVQRSDWVAQHVMKIARPHVGPGLWSRLEAAMQSGWARWPMDDEIARTLVELDADRANELFLALLSDATRPRIVRQSAARAIARTPTQRGAATEIILREADPFIVNDFVRGLQHGRWDEKDVIWRNAFESGDKAKMKAYDLGRVPHLKEIVAILQRLSAAVGPEVSKQLALGQRLEEFRAAVEAVERAYGAGPARDGDGK
jgi:hypothetical protein